jgi:hypothetical protein
MLDTGIEKATRYDHKKGFVLLFAKKAPNDSHFFTQKMQVS